MLQEDMTQGQIIRSFEINALINGSLEWSNIYENNSGIGNKRIILLQHSIEPSHLKVVVTKAAIPGFGPVTFSAFDGKKCKV